LNFRRTPATEASLIYGIALLLGFLFLAAANGWGPAIALSQWLAFLFLLPTWIGQTLAARFVRFKSKAKSFFWNVSVTSVISIVGLVLVQVALSGAHAAAEADKNVAKNAFGMLVFVYFISTTIGAVLTQWVFFKNSVEVKPGQSEYGAAPQSSASSKQKKK
jgi:ABC-type sugar transport system permease subunit